MPIIKKGSADNFMMMQRHPLQRSDMTMRAKGLLAYLMSLPHDWVIHRTELVSHFKDGKDAVFAALNELIALGYVVRQQGRGTKGKFAEVNYTASDVLLSLPQTDLPVADKPVTDLPVTVNPHLQRNTVPILVNVGPTRQMITIVIALQQLQQSSIGQSLITT